MKLEEQFDNLDRFIEEVEFFHDTPACIEIAENFAIGFAKFYFVEKVDETKENYKTTEQLLEIYKKTL